MTLVDGGTRQNVFQSIVDSSASRIPSPTPTPTPGGGDPVAPEPPLLSMYEQDMVYHGKAVGDWQQTVSTQDSQYYDGLRVHQQIRDYARANISSSQATLYLNNVARYISRSIQVVRDNYVIPNDGGVQDWRRFPKGLYYHYQETGDQDSYDALLMLRDGKTSGTGDPLNHPEFGQASWMREMSYWLQAHIWGEKLNGTRNVAKVSKYVEYLESQLRQVRNNDYTDVQNLITPVYYWIGMHFNDAEFIELGDKVFAGAAYHQTYWIDGMYGKRLGEMFLTSMDGLRWRQMYVDANND